MDEDEDFDKEEADGDGEGRGELVFLAVLGGDRTALIFKDDGGDAARSYSSMRFARSSSEVIVTRASRSSVGNWQRRLTKVAHMSPSFINSSVTES